MPILLSSPLVHFFRPQLSREVCQYYYLPRLFAFQAAAFLDPVCINALYLKPEKVRTKVLAFTTSKSFEFPDCCVKGLSYKKLYDLLETIKIRMAIRDFGHCGILDKFQWRGKWRWVFSCMKLSVGLQGFLPRS